MTAIACGENHSLVLTDKGYLYAWGRGFEGQLGLSKEIEIASTPQFVKFFHGKNVTSIACGSFYSLAVTDDGAMWGWGEARMGQLGCDKHREIRTPQRIQFPQDSEGNQPKIKSCSAGYGHTAALTDNGDLYTWGFNTYGQVGHGDKKTHWFPRRVEADADGNETPQFLKVACSKYATYAIDMLGRPYSWGKGFIGHEGEVLESQPRRITKNTDNRIFTDVFASSESSVFYAPIRVYEIYPKCGPSKGNTIVQIVGTGFMDSSKLRVRFTYGDLSKEVPCQFNSENDTLICQTPLFEEFDNDHPSLKLPCDCFLSVTMDGINYSECEEPFKIYSNDIFLTSVTPKSGSVTGGSQVTLSTNIDEETALHLQDLKIGFRPRHRAAISRLSQQQPSQEESGSKRNINQDSKPSMEPAPSNQGSQEKVNTSGFQEEERKSAQGNSPQAPQRSIGNESELADAWTTAEGYFENGKIIATVPKIDNFDPEQLTYSVDVALNGQQFTGRPVNFRYYDIQVQQIVPDIGPATGDTNILIVGKGLYDAGTKKIRFSTQDGKGVREVTADWEKQFRALRVTVPPYLWLFGEDAEREREEQEERQAVEGEGEQEEVQKLTAAEIDISLTFNN